MPRRYDFAQQHPARAIHVLIFVDENVPYSASDLIANVVARPQEFCWSGNQVAEICQSTIPQCAVVDGIGVGDFQGLVGFFVRLFVGRAGQHDVRKLFVARWSYQLVLGARTQTKDRTE